MKTKKELDALKEEVQGLAAKLTELSEDELEQVVGGQAVLPLKQAVLPLLSGTKEYDEQIIAAGPMDKYELAT